MYVHVLISSACTLLRICWGERERGGGRGEGEGGKGGETEGEGGSRKGDNNP